MREFRASQPETDRLLDRIRQGLPANVIQHSNN
jgi:hypothetical protein